MLRLAIVIAAGFLVGAPSLAMAQDAAPAVQPTSSQKKTSSQADAKRKLERGGYTRIEHLKLDSGVWTADTISRVGKISQKQDLAEEGEEIGVIGTARIPG